MTGREDGLASMPKPDNDARGQGRHPFRELQRPLHKQMLSRIFPTQDHIRHLLQFRQHAPAGVADAALQVFMHLAQRVFKPAFEWLKNALAFNVFVFAFVEVTCAAGILLVTPAIDFDRRAGGLLMACEK